MADTEIINKDGKTVEKSNVAEKLFFIERYFQRNRKKILFTATILVVGGFAYLADSILKNYENDLANQAYYNYSNGIEKSANLEIIEELNPKLFSLIKFSKAMSKNSIEQLTEFAKEKDQIISDLAEYQLISLNKDIAKLNEYSYKDRAIFRDLAIVSESYALMENGEMKEAQNRLSFIDDSSSLKEVAKYLNHFGAVSKTYDASSNKFMRDDLNHNGIVSE